MAIPGGSLMRRSNSASASRVGGHNTEMRLRMRKECEKEKTRTARRRRNSVGASSGVKRTGSRRKIIGKMTERKAIVDPNATSPPPWHVLSIISDLTEEKQIDSDDSTDTNSEYDGGADNWTCAPQQPPVPPPSFSRVIQSSVQSPLTPHTATRVFSTSAVKKTPRIRKKSTLSSSSPTPCPVMSPSSKSFLEKFPLLKEAMGEFDVSQRKNKKPPKGFVFEDTQFYKAQAAYFNPKSRGGGRKKKKSASTSTHSSALPLCVFDSGLSGGTPGYRLHTVSSSGLCMSVPPTRGKSPTFARARTDVFSKPIFSVQTSQELLYEVTSPRTTSPRSTKSPRRISSFI